MISQGSFFDMFVAVASYCYYYYHIVESQAGN